LFLLAPFATVLGIAGRRFFGKWGGVTGVVAGLAIQVAAVAYFNS
jgi:hypothetical protein